METRKVTTDTFARILGLLVFFAGIIMLIMVFSWARELYGDLDRLKEITVSLSHGTGEEPKMRAKTPPTRSVGEGVGVRAKAPDQTLPVSLTDPKFWQEQITWLRTWFVRVVLLFVFAYIASLVAGLGARLYGAARVGPVSV